MVQTFLAETVETGNENLVDVLDNSARYSTDVKTEKHVECVSKWCHLFYVQTYRSTHRSR